MNGINSFGVNAWEHFKIVVEEIPPLGSLQKEMFKNRQALAVDVWSWQHGGDSFSSMLLSLFTKADPGNQKRLENSFPELTSSYWEWYYAPGPSDFYERYKIQGHG